MKRIAFCVSIPQAVGTVATLLQLAMYMINIRIVSIPQAVGTVATILNLFKKRCNVSCFNTASGRYCCNLGVDWWNWEILPVSIPQAVGTVATLDMQMELDLLEAVFQYRKR